MSRPCDSSAFAFTNTSNAVSVPSRAIRLARRSSRVSVTTAKSALIRAAAQLVFLDRWHVRTRIRRAEAEQVQRAAIFDCKTTHEGGELSPACRRGEWSASQYRI